MEEPGPQPIQETLHGQVSDTNNRHSNGSTVSVSDLAVLNRLRVWNWPWGSPEAVLAPPNEQAPDETIFNNMLYEDFQASPAISHDSPNRRSSAGEHKDTS